MTTVSVRGSAASIKQSHSLGPRRVARYNARASSGPTTAVRLAMARATAAFHAVLNRDDAAAAGRGGLDRWAIVVESLCRCREMDLCSFEGDCRTSQDVLVIKTIQRRCPSAMAPHPRRPKTSGLGCAPVENATPH